ncbi:MAG: exopolyphosphatase [Phormidesmis sp. FL-bin-119]|nr:exopolyphosphatase [Pedobacter sp.]
MIKSEVSNHQTSNNKPTRIAILDLGTNTFHLLIADIEIAGKAKIVLQETIAVGLGEGGISKSFISIQAFKRGINALRIFKKRIDKYQAGSVSSAATSAIRSAANGKEFIEKITTETGLIIQTIDGEREAELIYQGVRAAVPMEQNSLIVDIGGGSVEFIICDSSKMYWKKSYPIGAARLMERFHYSDPISDTAVGELNTYFENTLTDLFDQIKIYRPKLMIGSAGSFETFAQLQDHNFKVSFDQPEQVIDLAVFCKLSERIIKSTHAEREKMPAIPAIRVDMIVVSTLLTRFIINKSGIDTLKLSAYSLKEGMLFELAK